jgi:hypothetical protein
LLREKLIMSVVKVTLLPWPTGPAATEPSAPSLNVLAYRLSIAFCELTTITVSAASPPKAMPMLAEPIV